MSVDFDNRHIRLVDSFPTSPQCTICATAFSYRSLAFNHLTDVHGIATASTAELDSHLRRVVDRKQLAEGNAGSTADGASAATNSVQAAVLAERKDELTMLCEICGVVRERHMSGAGMNSVWCRRCIGIG